METLLTEVVVPAHAHALPFRIILEEHRLRREADLLRCAADVFAAMKDKAPVGNTTEEKLVRALQDQQDAYSKLEAANRAIVEGGNKDTLDGLIEVCRAADEPLKRLMHMMDASAICLSGGGIRSASFSLGILQGLSRFGGDSPDGIMRKLDYLSTVSGGGYIGSWMMSWVYRRMRASEGENWPVAYNEVIDRLAGEARKTGGDPDPQPVRHLRTYTSYLAPLLGFTLDTFTLAAIVLRNFIVNWVMLVPILIALIALVRLSGALLPWVSWHLPSWWGARHCWGITWGAFVNFSPFAIAAIAAGLALPSHIEAKRMLLPTTARDKYKPHSLLLVRLFLASVIAGCWLLTMSVGEGNEKYVFISKSLIAFVGFFLLSWSIYSTYISRADLNAASPTRRGLMVLASMVAVSSIMAAATGGLLALAETKFFPILRQGTSVHPWVAALKVNDHLFVVLGLPTVVSILTITTTVYCALLGVFEGEDDREWWARTGGWLLAFNLAWMLAHAMAFYGSCVWAHVISGILGLVTGLASSYLGYSGATAAQEHPTKTSNLGGIGKFLAKHNLVLPIIGGAAILLITFGMVAVEETIRRKAFDISSRPVFSCLAMFIAWSALAITINVAININLFSLHGMYRMRLMRAFLGASNVLRHPDAFTQFDRRDTPRQAEMPCCSGVPMHLLNATVNLTGTKNPAWRQRKGEGFSFSPVVCGGWRIGYVPTPIYAGSQGRNQKETGITLATAMAISGAAANPNMGYQSSEVLSLLMTFFNLRLGYWLPNPARSTPNYKLPGNAFPAAGVNFLRKSGPSFALWPLFAEALQMTDDSYRWIELTDGGHFENLGLYEMVMRRVKHIVVVDAGADPHFGFEDLGNAIRKIQIDLGIPITFDENEGLKMKPGAKLGNSYCAVAKIHYECVDPTVEVLRPDGKVTTWAQDKMNGTLIYIKASLNGLEPADILQYARTHKTFPHESTGDQFFTESQFESYRHLGSYMVERIAGTDKATTGDPSMEGFRVLAKNFYNKAVTPP